jgi:CRISPR-associated protein Csd1
MMSIPRRVIRAGTKIKADFLCDKSEYIFGVVPDGSPSAKSADKPENCRKAFLTQMELAHKETTSPLLQAAVSFLQNEDQRAVCIAKLCEEKDWASNDLFTFSCEGQLLHSDSAIRQWWASAQQGEAKEGTQLRQCLVCGANSVPVESHDKLKIPGGMSAGVPLVSFNTESFLKYGLSGKDNAPICRPCMTAYVEGLRRCLNERYPSPQDSNVMMGRQSVRLTPDTTAVYWTDVPWQLSSGLALLLNQPEDLNATLRSPYEGQRAAKLDGTFYCIIISGAQGRAMLRSVHTGTVEQVELSLKEYFDALRIEGSDSTRPLPLYALLSSLAPREKLAHLPPKLPGQVFLSAVLGEPLPRMILNAAVSRNRAEQKVTPARAALLQLYFCRHKLEGFKMPLDPKCTAPAYVLGRLFAVLEKLQYNAQGRINSTIVDRFYGAASSRPGTVFPQLMKLAQTHVKKSNSAGYFQDRMGEVISKLDAGFPAMLSLEEQGQFALGFYHEKWSRSNKNDMPSVEDAPQATEGEN